MFTRTVPGIAAPRVPADILAKCSDWNAEATWGVLNICADWGQSLAEGLLGRRRVAERSREEFGNDPEAVDFLGAAIESVDAALALVQRYAEVADREGLGEVAARLHRVPAGAPTSFHDALQSLRFLHGMLWLSGTMHAGLGRFDQYMWPYLQRDLKAGTLNEETAASLLTEFFISLNRDSDLYPGVQRGDNGQSMMLGGVTRGGRPAVNPLTWMALHVSREVNMIDPKINLRITKDTDLGLLIEASRLTRQGLGFPQYANDEVVIPALVAHGYSLEDARDYTVAACWEFIIPGRGMDVPNIQALNFPAAADSAIRKGLAECETFDHILERTREGIRRQVQLYANRWRKKHIFPPNPFYSVLMSDCLERGKDIDRGGATYYNYGIHGAGSANAADALAAVKQFVFEEKRISGAEIVDALNSNFENDEPLRLLLRNHGPKTGNNEELTNSLLRFMYDCFAEACEAESDNGREGLFRPGTGSAMYYLFLVDENSGMLEPTVSASADGRLKGEPLGCGLSPALGARVQGPISMLQTYANIDYNRVCNGGPITMELSDAVFRNAEALEKVAMLVRTFAQLGCQQLQLNTLNAEKLREAKRHPEEHRNLIVRVWGWSGYFCELDEPYQEHVMARHMHCV